MGCTNSVTEPSSSSTSFKTISSSFKTAQVTFSPQTDLTPQELATVKSTWHYISRDMSRNGLQVFLKMFELSPEAKKLFHVEDVRHSELARNVIIRGHGTRFMSTIGVAVERLKDSDYTKEKLDEVLFTLGQQHKRYSGFRQEYFETFYKALMWRWEQCMQDEFTQEVANTWSHVFVYMLEKVKEGYNSEETSKK